LPETEGAGQIRALRRKRQRRHTIARVTRGPAPCNSRAVDSPSESWAMHISSSFDSGNIECVECAQPADIRLAIRKDNNSDFYQWFHFRLVGARGRDCTLRIMNAGGAAYPKGWEGYRACASYDRRDWFRVPTTYDAPVLSITHRPEYDSVYYAYFAPYSVERHARLVARGLPGPRAPP